MKLAEKDKVRFDKQKADFDEKGWFTNEDGTKSNSAASAAKISVFKRFNDDVLLPKRPSGGYS